MSGLALHADERTGIMKVNFGKLKKCIGSVGVQCPSYTANKSRMCNRCLLRLSKSQGGADAKRREKDSY